MTIGPPGDPNEPLIPRKWGPILSAAATIAASVLIWLVQVAGTVDSRIKELEIDMNHLIDQAGEVRPSKAAINATTDLRVLEARLDELEKRLGVSTK